MNLQTVIYKAIHSELHVIYGVQGDEHYITLFNEYTGEGISTVKIDGPVTSINADETTICFTGLFTHYGDFVCPYTVAVDHKGNVLPDA